MGMGLVDEHDNLEKRRTVGFFEDFNDALTTGGKWTFSGSDTTSTYANNDAVDGLFTLATANVKNKEAWIYSTRANWQVTANKPIMFEARINYQDGNVNTAGIFIGLASGWGTGMLVDTTWALKSSFSGLFIYKLPGQTVWYAGVSNGTTQATITSAIAAGGNSDEVLRIESRPISSTVAEVAFFVDPAAPGGSTNPLAPGASSGSSTGGLQQMLDTTFNRPQKLQYTYTSAVKMAPGAFLKAGDTTIQTLLIDYFGVEMLR